MKNAHFLGKKLLFITAHPDDESYAIVGTIYANQASGGESYLICATLGGDGKAHLFKPLSAKKLIKKRRVELMRAVRILKVKKLFILGLDDGKVTNEIARARKKIFAIASKIKPDYLLSFGEDGISGHLDHIAIGKVSRKIAEILRIPFTAFAISPARLKLNPKFFVRRRRFGKYSKSIKHQKPTMRVKINSKIKIRAVNCHKTQLGGNIPFSHLPPKVKKEVLQYEYFRRE